VLRLAGLLNANGVGKITKRPSVEIVLVGHRGVIDRRLQSGVASLSGQTLHA